jgi:hypothetical protein
MSMMPQNQMTSASGGGLVNRLIGVITLKAPVYREIADDTTATTEAGIIVVVVSLIVGIIGAFVGVGVPGVTTNPEVSTVSIAIVAAITGLIASVLGWLVGGWVTAFVARQFFQGKTDTGEMLRVFGYTRIFSLFGIVPIIGGIIGAILGIIGNIIGIREAAEFDTTKAILTAIIAGIIVFFLVVIVAGIIGGILAVIVLGASAIAR